MVEAVVVLVFDEDTRTELASEVKSDKCSVDANVKVPEVGCELGAGVALVEESELFSVATSAADVGAATPLEPLWCATPLTPASSLLDGATLAPLAAAVRIATTAAVEDAGPLVAVAASTDDGGVAVVAAANAV